MHVFACLDRPLTVSYIRLVFASMRHWWGLHILSVNNDNKRPSNFMQWNFPLQGVSWETVCNRNGNSNETRTCQCITFECFRLSMCMAISCWAHGGSAQFGHQCCVCFSLSTEFLCCGYNLRSICCWFCVV